MEIIEEVEARAPGDFMVVSVLYGRPSPVISIPVLPSRTMLVKRQERHTCRPGAGVVADSVPERANIRNALINRQALVRGGGTGQVRASRFFAAG